MEVSVTDARASFVRLLQRVEIGEEITITRRGTPIARLVPIVVSRASGQGMDQGRVWIADDFDAPDPEIEALFYGKPPSKAPSRKR